MATAHHDHRAFFLASVVLAAASVVYPAVASAAATYQTASAKDTAQVISASTKIGQLGEDTYFVKDAGMGYHQIFKVNTADMQGSPNVRFASVGLIVNGKLTIHDQDEAKQFQQVVDNMTVAQARAIGLNGGDSAAQTPTTTQTASFQQGQQELTGNKEVKTAAEGTVVKKADGTIEATVNGRVVDFQNNGSHILVRTTSGPEVGELQFVGVQRGSSAGQKAKGGLRVVGNLALSGLTQGHAQQASINPNTYTITLPSGFTINSEDINNGGKSMSDPNGIIATTVAAEDLVRAKLDPGFTLPADKHLRSKAGSAVQ